MKQLKSVIIDAISQQAQRSDMSLWNAIKGEGGDFSDR